MIDEDAIRQRWEAVGSKLDERGRRLFAAGEVRTAGWGGLAVVSKITGLARSTINRGEDDLDVKPLRKGAFAVAGIARAGNILQACRCALNPTLVVYHVARNFDTEALGGLRHFLLIEARRRRRRGRQCGFDSTDLSCRQRRPEVVTPGRENPDQIRA